MYTSIMTIILNLFLYSLISIKVRWEWWSFPAERLMVWNCAACSDISHTLEVIIDVYGEIVRWCLLVVENQKGSQTETLPLPSTVFLTYSHPGLDPRLHHINPLFKLPELCHGDVTIMDIRSIMYRSKTQRFYYIKCYFGATCFDSFCVIFRPSRVQIQG